MDIKSNLLEVKNNIEIACQRVNRKPEDITLIAVSKTKPIEDMAIVLQEGILEVGENKVQEISNKYPEFETKFNWHMIGHLQTNKVKYIIDKVCLIHSVDSLKLANKINEEAKKVNKVMAILIQVNIASEASKFGIDYDSLYTLIEEISCYKNIRIKGLMTVPPYVENPEDNRVFFKEMKKISVDINSKNIDNVSMDVLSMGMTNDYMIAIEEGSTMVRLGTAIFGERYYT